MDLIIDYDKGSMLIHLEEFLNFGSITKVRKLVKLIHQSVNPDDIGKLRTFIEQELEQIDLRKKENERYIVGYEDKMRFCHKQLENCIYTRDHFLKKGSREWVHYNLHVKQHRQELKEIKALLNSKKSDCNRFIRNKQFYVKCLENIS
jgi:hypothetical protein